MESRYISQTGKTIAQRFEIKMHSICHYFHVCVKDFNICTKIFDFSVSPSFPGVYSSHPGYQYVCFEFFQCYDASFKTIHSCVLCCIFIFQCLNFKFNCINLTLQHDIFSFKISKSLSNIQSFQCF